MLCKESIGGPFYSCLECNNIFFHVDCVHLSKEVNHPCHFKHPLKIITRESLIDDDVQKYCHLCFMQPKYMLYHCSICNFIVCLGCTKLPPPVVVDYTKTHKHPLRLLSSKVVFTCKLCGVEGCENGPYICIECNFLVHGCCVDLPQVININRHDHRISFSHHLHHGRTKCGVCRQSVSPYYGAYSCLICPAYAVHSRCAINLTLWNGVELEGIPEINEDIAPFKVVGDDLIRHFIHGNHNLRFLKDYVMVHDNKWLRCEACVCPLGFDPIYACEECVSVIHEKCANLPMKKKLVFDPAPYKLEYGGSAYCKLCGIFSGGFKYRSQRHIALSRFVDVHCGSISEPFVHDGHLHPLYFGKTENHHCDGCKRVLDDNMLTCGACNFDLCLYCATLPEKIWHMSDEHPLTLYYGEKSNGTNSCEICEMELDPSIWFFTCSDCGVTLHVQCVLGDFSRFKPGESITIKGDKYKAVLNNHNSRPFCRHCHERCKVSIIIKEDDEQKNGYICSTTCLLGFFGITL